MQKIAIISDIHGNIAALESVAADIKTRQVDCIINLGDHISGPLWPKETIEYLMRQDWIQISGNHDRQLIKQNPRDHGLSDSHAFQFLNDSEIRWLQNLPTNLIFHDSILLFHGTPSSDTTYLLESIENGGVRLATQLEIKKRLGDTKLRVMLCGHSHIPRVVEVCEDKLIVNPGSVGLPAYEDKFPEYHRVENGSHHARYAILEFKNGYWQSEIFAISYDYQKAAKQALKNNRPEWAAGIQWGYMQKK